MLDKNSASDHAITQIATALRALGIRAGGVVLVHSSLRSLGPVEGGAESVVQAFLEVLGADGTLMMPALSYDYVNSAHPLFDVIHTPSNVGALPEYFRTRPGTQRSLHPTHSVCALGPLAADLLKSHNEDNTPCGRNSPFSLLREAGGQLCFLGCGMRPNTSMYAIEEHIIPPYLFGPEVSYQLRNAEGSEWSQIYRTHNFHGWEQRYDLLAEIMEPQAFHVGACLQATLHLLEAPAMWKQALAALRHNPLCFVDPA